MLHLDNIENRRMVEMCYKTHTTTINPIIDWTNDEVWEFIKEYNVPYCCLYDEGFKRIGCIGCPMGSVKQRQYEFDRYPKYKVLYLKAFEKMIENRGGYNETADGWLYWYINGIQRNDTTTNNGVVDSIEQTEREGE